MANRKLGSGVGTLASLATSVFLQTTPRWGAEHPHYVLALYAITLVVAVIYALQFEWLRNAVFAKPESSIYESPGNSGNQVGRDNKGRMVQTGPIGTYVEAASLHPPPPPPKVKPPVNLVPLGAGLDCIEDREQQMYGSKRLDILSVFRIRNVIPSQTARALCASISFTGNHGIAAHVQRAFWYGKSYHEIEIGINHEAAVVLGKYADRKWVYFDNPQRHVPEWHGPRQAYSEYDPPKSIPFSSGDITAELVVFNPYDGENFLLKARFLISEVNENACMVKRLDDEA